MRNYVQPGDSLALAVPYAAGVTSGQGVLVGALFGVAAIDGVQNAVIECQTKGVFDITKEPALAITAGVPAPAVAAVTAGATAAAKAVASRAPKPVRATARQRVRRVLS